jgi:hypothetical protein
MILLQVLTILLQTFYSLLMNFLQSSNKLRMIDPRISNYNLQTSYHILTNFLQSS